MFISIYTRKRSIASLSAFCISFIALPANANGSDNAHSSSFPSLDNSIDLSDLPQELVPKLHQKVKDPGVDVPSKVSELSSRVGDGTSIYLQPLAESKLIPLGQQRLPALKLEASYNEPITLRDALEITLEQNLPIKIVKADYDSSKFNYFGSFANFLPSLSTALLPLRIQGGGANLSTSPFYTLLNYPVFQGGTAFFGAIKSRHMMRASRYALSTEINKALLSVFDKYMDVLAAKAILEVRTIAVDVAKEQHKTNSYMKAAGLGTQFDCMQSATLMAQEKQKLIRAEVDLRQATLKLAVALNVPVFNNLVPKEEMIPSDQLVNPALSAQDLTKIALGSRPEIRQYRNLQQAAKADMELAAAPLLPYVGFYQVSGANTEVRGSGSGGSQSLVIPVGTSGLSTVVGSGGNSFFANGFILNWNVTNAAIGTGADVMSARAQARKALLKLNQEILDISEQVRSAYIESLANQSEIEAANEQVRSSAEEMRLADQRLKYSLGTNLELVQSEKDFISALTNRVEAIVKYRKSQARLLYAIGKVSVETLTTTTPLSFENKR